MDRLQCIEQCEAAVLSMPWLSQAVHFESHIPLIIGHAKMYMDCLLLVCKTEILKELSSSKKILLCRMRKRCNYLDLDYNISVSHSKPKLIVFSAQINSRVTIVLANRCHCFRNSLRKSVIHIDV